MNRVCHKCGQRYTPVEGEAKLFECVDCDVRVATPGYKRPRPKKTAKPKAEDT